MIVAVFTVWGLSSAQITVPDKPPVNTASIILFALVNSYEPTYDFVCHFFVDLREKYKIDIGVFRSGPQRYTFAFSEEIFI